MSMYTVCAWRRKGEEYLRRNENLAVRLFITNPVGYLDSLFIPECCSLDLHFTLGTFQVRNISSPCDTFHIDHGS